MKMQQQQQQQQQHDSNSVQDETAGATTKIVNFQPKDPCSVRIKKSSSFRIRGISHNWTGTTAASSSAASAESTGTTATTSIGASSSAASTVSLDSFSSLFRLGHSSSSNNNNSTSTSNGINNSPTKSKQHKKSISSKLGGGENSSSRTISPLRKLFHLGGSSNKDKDSSSTVKSNNEQNCTSTTNNTNIEACGRTCSEVSLSPKPENDNFVNQELNYVDKVQGCAEQQIIDFVDFTVPRPLHMQQNETNDDNDDDDDDDLSLEKDSPQVGILTKISEEVSVSMDSIEISKNEVWNKRLGSERMPDSDDKKLVFNNVIYPPKGKILTDILYLNSTTGPCDIDSVLDDEMDDLECRLTSRTQFLGTKQEQEQQQQLLLSSTIVVPNEEEKQKVNSSQKLMRTSSTIGGTSRAKLLRSETASSLLSTTSIRTGISSTYDTSDDTISEACTFISADTGSMSLNIVGSDGIFGVSSCDSFLNTEKDFTSNNKQLSKSIGPVDVDDFIPKDSMYFEEDYGDWFILDEVEISRGLAGYEIGFEPETIWSVNLDDISISSNNCRTKKSTRGMKTNNNTNTNTNRPLIPTNSKARLLSTTRKPKLSRARSSIV